MKPLLSREAFEQLVREGFMQLPEKFRAKIKNVAILIEDEPDDEVRKIEGLGNDETLLGYYRGIPHTVRGGEYGVGMTMPDTITLYQLPIEEEAGGDTEAIKRVVAETIWHEVAHYFGYDEHGVRRREGERDT